MGEIGCTLYLTRPHVGLPPNVRLLFALKVELLAGQVSFLGGMDGNKSLVKWTLIKQINAAQFAGTKHAVEDKKLVDGSA